MNYATPRPDQSDETGGSGSPGGLGWTGHPGAPGGPEGDAPRGAASDGWEVLGSAGRGVVTPEEADRAARAYWEAEASTYQAEHGRFLSSPRSVVVDSVDSTDRIDYQPPGTGFVWGPEGVTEAELGMLGPLGALAGRTILEVGCGAAQCSAWLAARGVFAVGIDIAVNQLRHTARSSEPRRSGTADGDRGPTTQAGGLRSIERPDATTFAATDTPRGTGGAGHGPDPVVLRPDPVVLGADPATPAPPGALHVVAATATALPFADAAFDVAFASYGAIQFVADLPVLLAEVRRVLAPGGRWVFSVTHPIRWAFPDDPGPAGLSASGSYFDRDPYVERDADGVATYAEFHRTIGDYVAALAVAGFTIEAMVEPEWPEWNDRTWGGWSPLRGLHLPGTLIIGCRAGASR